MYGQKRCSQHHPLISEKFGKSESLLGRKPEPGLLHYLTRTRSSSEHAALRNTLSTLFARHPQILMPGQVGLVTLDSYLNLKRGVRHIRHGIADLIISTPADDKTHIMGKNSSLVKIDPDFHIWDSARTLLCSRNQADLENLNSIIKAIRDVMTLQKRLDLPFGEDFNHYYLIVLRTKKSRENAINSIYSEIENFEKYIKKHNYERTLRTFIQTLDSLIGMIEITASTIILRSSLLHEKPDKDKTIVIPGIVKGIASKQMTKLGIPHYFKKHG